MLRRSFATLCAAIGLTCTTRAAETNSDLQAAQTCVEQLQVFVEKISQLEASVTNDTTRLDCITDKLVKIKSLLELTQTSAERLPSLIADEDEHEIEIERAELSIARARAEKLAAEAEACTSETVPKPRRHHAPTDALPIKPRPAAALVKRLAPRNVKNCIPQRELTRLLALAMELPFDVQKSADAALAKLAIEPLGGWQPDKCATLDDLCVAVARALNLKVESPTDPASYSQALRDDGLPVDALLPARTEGVDPPLLLESEVRAFFAAGYVVPLSSSRPLNPD